MWLVQNFTPFLVNSKTGLLNLFWAVVRIDLLFPFSHTLHPGHLVLFYFQNNLWDFNAFLLLSSLAEITKLAYHLVFLFLSLYPYFHWFIPSTEENGPIKTETKEHSSVQHAEILSYFRQHKSHHPQRDLQCPKWYDFLPPPCFRLWVNF